MVWVSVYVVVAVGLTFSDALAELNPDGDEFQLYVCPLMEAFMPIVTVLPEHIVVSFPAFTDGSGLTVIVTESDFVQPVVEFVSVR